jgi:exosome complex RNA-binding protein Rrp42 (RNase PH superfamily)
MVRALSQIVITGESLWSMAADINFMRHSSILSISFCQAIQQAFLTMETYDRYNEFNDTRMSEEILVEVPLRIPSQSAVSTYGKLRQAGKPCLDRSLLLSNLIY